MWCHQKVDDIDNSALNKALEEQVAMLIALGALAASSPLVLVLGLPRKKVDVVHETGAFSEAAEPCLREYKDIEVKRGRGPKSDL